MEQTKSISKFKGPDGIWRSGADMSAFSAFEEDYIYARTREQRVLSIADIRKLPEVNADYIHATEWQMRKRSISRFQRYMNNNAPMDAILDVGCGNGFFTNILSRYAKKVIGVDVNLTELMQACEAFDGNSALEWYYADIFDSDVFEESFFDRITFCCSLQYFPDMEKIMRTCFRLLKQDGSVHILESPFYQTSRQQTQARERTIQYYKRIGMEACSKHYFHHTWDRIKPYNPVIRYWKKGGLKSIFSRGDSPFPWLEISRNALIDIFGNR
jgi:ubiquinone/menaquinone biosynthesis C-methylase UbiE